jgi:hypothetical protein
MIRWFESKTIWLQIAGLGITLANIALVQLPGIGLDARPLLYWTLGLNAFINIATWYVRAAPNVPTPPVGTKAQVEASK